MAKCDWMTETDVKDAMVRGINNASAAHTFGVNYPRQDPIQSAISAIQKGIWEKNFKDSIGKWEKKLAMVTIEEWKAATTAAASMYAEKASTIGAEEWGKYYDKAKSVIESAATEYVKSDKKKENMIKFWTDMQKLKNL